MLLLQLGRPLLERLQGRLAEFEGRWEQERALVEAIRALREQLESHAHGNGGDADAFGTGTPAGAAAAAVYMSGGSVGPVGSMEIPPPPGVCGTLVSTSVILAAVTGPPKEIAASYQAFVAQGLSIITQLGGWDAAIAATWQVLDAQQRAHAPASAPPATSGPAPSGVHA